MRVRWKKMAEHRDQHGGRDRRGQLEPVHEDAPDVERGVGDADVEPLDVGAPGHLAEALEEEVQPDGRHEQDDRLLVDERPQHHALDREGERHHDGHGQPEREPDRRPALHEADQRQRREQHHDALGEVEDARGLEDQDEPEGHERVHEARRDPADQHLGQEGRVGHHVGERRDQHRADELHGDQPSPGGPRRVGPSMAPRRSRRVHPRRRVTRVRLPRYAAMTAGFARTSSGGPSAILRP